jgi:hypothetical protein
MDPPVRIEPCCIALIRPRAFRFPPAGDDHVTASVA